ncbi:MAG: hypothetical protein Q4B58_04820, partial [Bacteroidales bacterium]|nr:hypothetical protein [Bacteroidales bacterium]
MKYLLTNFFNTLRHYKVSSLLNITGMAVAFAAFYLIMTQVMWGFGYNKGIEGADRIYLMTMPNVQNPGKQNIYLSRPLAEKILSEAPGIEAYGTATMSTGIMAFYQKIGDGTRRLNANCQQFTPGVLRMFRFEAEEGSLEAISAPETIAISSKFARANGLKVGDYLSPEPSGEKNARKIVAIWKDKYPTNSSLSVVDMLIDIRDFCIDLWDEWSFPYFVQFKSVADKEAFEQYASKEIYEWLREQNSDLAEVEEAAKQMQTTMIPFEELYYTDVIEQKIAVSIAGSRTTDITLLAVAILIVLIALINFVNFFFALVPARVRSVNTYKVFGTSRTQLIVNFVLEAVGLVLIALLLAAVIVILFGKSAAVSVLSAPIALDNNMLVLYATIAAALVGSLTGAIYPAFYITSFQPALVLKGSFGSSKAGRSLRNLLIGVQFTISIVLIICAMFISLQRNYMLSQDMGFDKEYLITGDIGGRICWYQPNNKAFEDRLRQNPDIVDITWANGELVNAMNRMGWGRSCDEKEIHFQCYPVAYNFLEVLGIEVTEGRNFVESDEQSQHGVFIFNEKARDQYELTLESKCGGHHEEAALVAGFCRNFNFRPLQYGIDPFAFFVFGQDHSWRAGFTTLYVRIHAGANPGKVMEYIRQTIQEMAPEVDPDNIGLKLFDEELDSKYASEEKLSLLITLFTVIAIILSLMGVFGLVLFETQHRKKEIAIRRVLGAEVEDILTLLSRKYSIIVTICFVIAIPL